MPESPYVDFKTVKSSVSMLRILDHYGLTEHFKRNNDSLTGACPLHNGENPTQFRVSISKTVGTVPGNASGAATSSTSLR